MSTIKIHIAREEHAEALAHLGTTTYVESHGHFISDKNDLVQYIATAFSLSTTKKELNDSKNRFYIVYADDLPVGYAKLVLQKNHESVPSTNACRLERIYILSDFIHLKIGQRLLKHLVEKAVSLQFEVMWLSVYVKNHRAIRFYEKNDFENVGELYFLVNGKEYENIVFSKKIDSNFRK